METKIRNLSNSLDDNLTRSANEVCDGIESVFDKKSVNMCGDLFDSGKVFYLNSNEELRMGRVVKPGSNTATVLGSGDFVIDSIYNGINDITCFDINKYQYYLASLKIKSLQNMSYDEYCSFFSDKGKTGKLLDILFYEKLKRNSSYDPSLYTFMDVLIKRFNQAKLKIREEIMNNPLYALIQDLKSLDDPALEEFVEKLKSSIDNDENNLFLNYIFTMFGRGYDSPEVLHLFHGTSMVKSPESYVENEKNYNITKDMVKDSNIKFVSCDISKFKDVLKEKGCLDSSFKGFQSIYLSNIPEYMRGDYFVNNVIDNLMDILTDDGIIVYCCQGVTGKDLKTGKSAVFDIISNPEYSLQDSNPFNRIRLVNDVCGYQLLEKRNYDVSMDEADSLSVANGYRDKDTFVYVKKK